MHFADSATQFELIKDFNIKANKRASKKFSVQRVEINVAFAFPNFTSWRFPFPSDKKWQQVLRWRYGKNLIAQPFRQFNATGQNAKAFVKLVETCFSL